MNSFSFRKGFEQVRQKDVKDVREKLTKVIGIKLNNRMSWSKWLNGKVEPKVTQKEAIEKVFAEYGIKEVWGE